MDHTELDALVAAVLARKDRAIARVISEVENATPAGKALLRALRPHANHARTIGVTGPPGAGKSTLVGALITEYHKRDLSVGIVAVDPSSSTSGGAVLGDRVRMMRSSGAAGAFIRSLGSRGHPGALSRATAEVADVLDAAGFDRVIIETVGAGQSDIEAAEISDTLVVVCPPGLGDEIQAIKSGLMEVADVFVVSKGDLPLAKKAESDLLFMLGTRPSSDWTPPVVRIVASQDEGIGALTDAIELHSARKTESRGVSAAQRIRKLIASDAATIVRQAIATDESEWMKRLCDAVLTGEVSDSDAATRAIAQTLSRKPPVGG